jgi:hypothetical protein
VAPVASWRWKVAGLIEARESVESVGAGLGGGNGEGP